MLAACLLNPAGVLGTCREFLSMLVRYSKYRLWSIALPFVLICFLFSSPASACEPLRTGRDDEGYQSFFFMTSKFVPIGVNYFHLHRGAPYFSFDTFDPGEFDAAALRDAFGKIKAQGYNYVRVFLSGYYPDAGFNRRVPGIGDDYLNNIAQTLSIAQDYDLHVVLTGLFKSDQWLPLNYLADTSDDRQASIGGMNKLMLLPAFAKATAAFYRDLLAGLKKKDPALLSCVFYLDLYNELHFNISRPPLSLSSGKFMFLNYPFDLADPVARQQLVDRAAEVWLTEVIAAVKSVDKALLVTASTFPNTSFGRAHFDGASPTMQSRQRDDSPYPVRPQVLQSAGADLLDVHLYPYPSSRDRTFPALHEDLPRVLSSINISPATARQMPIVIGEFGAYKSLFSAPATAIGELHETLNALCRYHVAGWAYWMWNGPGTTWALTDDGGVLNRALPKKQSCDIEH